MPPARAIPWSLAALLVLCALAMVNLPMPFGADQANFIVGARVLDAGGALYRDYWEVNQPAIFGIYWLAGALGGFDEVGVHALELAWQLGLAAFLVATLRKRFAAGWALALVPLFAIGIYLASASDWFLTQKEALAGLPLYAVLWSAVRGAEDPARRTRWVALSGLAGGLALVLKLLFAPILAGLWVVALATIRLREGAVPLAAAARWTLVLACAAALPPAGVAGWFAAHGRLDDLLWVSFVVPPLTLAEGPPPQLARLVEAASWYVRHYGATTALAGVGAWAALRRRFDPLVAGCVVWIAAGALVYLVQRTSWWAYHVLLVTVPVGILAALGAEALVGALRERRGTAAGRALVAVAVVLAVGVVAPSLRRLERKAVDLATCSFDARCFQDRQSPFYAGLREEARFLEEPGRADASFYSAGNPVLYQLTGTLPAVAVHGWNFEANPRVVNERFVRELEAARPDALFVDATYDGVLEERAPEVLGAIEAMYAPVRVSEVGRWYRPRAPAPAPAAPPAATADRS